MKLNGASFFWIFVIFLTVLSILFVEIENLIEIIFNGYLGFIKTIVIFGSPPFILFYTVLISTIAKNLFKKRLTQFYNEFFFNSSLVWIEVFPVLWINSFYGIKQIVIAFSIVNIFLCVPVIETGKKVLKPYLDFSKF